MLINELTLRPLKYPLASIDLMELNQFLTKHCSEIISIMQNTGKSLQRGVRGKFDLVFYEKTPINRNPLSTKEVYNTQINKQLQAAGFKALRSNSIFCKSSNPGRFYGPTYLIMPINGFDYTWCQTAYDLTITYNLDIDPDQVDYKLSLDFDKSLFNDDPKVFVKKYGFTNKNIEKCLLLNYEIYIHGKYIAMQYDSDDDIAYVNKNILSQILKKL